MLPKAIQNLIESLQLLPGIGAKTAERLAFYLLNAPDENVDKIASSLMNLKNSLVKCEVCQNVADENPCGICSDRNRDQNTICVVESPLDVIALEKGGDFKGVYHVLGGSLSPVDGIGPEQIKISELFGRVGSSDISEIILATNPTLEGEATAMYIQRELVKNNSQIKLTRIARGLPVGAGIEYADEITLKRAMEGRREY